MKINFHSSLVVGLALIQLTPSASFADAVFPLSSGRPQIQGDCWAYGTSHMLEARAEFRDHVSVMTNIEKSYRYYLIYDRLMNSYHKKAIDDGDGSGEGVNDIGGYAADLFAIYANHGFELISVNSSTGASGFAYPNNMHFPNGEQGNNNAYGLRDTALVLKTEKDLISGNYTEAEADALIRTRLSQAFTLSSPLSLTTTWQNTSVPVTSTFEKILGKDFLDPTHSAVYLTTSSTAVGNQKWLRYNSDKSLGIAFTDKTAILKVLRASLDRGWPTTIESIDHVMTLLGYKTLPSGKFMYAVSDSSGAYNPEGVSWQSESAVLSWMTDSTVYYDVVKDLLPARDVSKAAMPLVKLPRKH